MRAEVLLSRRFHPLRLLRPLAEDDSSPAEAFVEDGPLLGRDRGDEATPFFVVGVGLRSNRLSQRADRFRLRAEDPEHLRVADGDRHDDLGLPRGDLSAPQRFAHERPVTQLAREPRLLRRCARVHSELLAGVVADVRVAEVHGPASGLERVEGIADGELKGAAAGGDVVQQVVDAVRNLPGEARVADPRNPRAERRRHLRYQIEPSLQFEPWLARAIRV